MTAPEPAPAPPLTQPPPQPKRRTGRIILIVVVAMVLSLALLIGGCFLLVNNATADAQKVSDDFVAAVQAGDSAKAYSLTGPAFREATDQAGLDQLVQQLSGLVAKDAVSPSGKSINTSTETGTIAVFTYTLPAAEGDASIYWKTQMREEDDGWQLMNFRSAETELDTDVE